MSIDGRHLNGCAAIRLGRRLRLFAFRRSLGLGLSSTRFRWAALHDEVDARLARPRRGPSEALRAPGLRVACGILANTPLIPYGCYEKMLKLGAFSRAA